MESRLIPVRSRFRSFCVSKANGDWVQSGLKYSSKQAPCGCGIYCQKGRRYSEVPKWTLFVTRIARSREKVAEDSREGSEKSGTVIGAVALIIGTSIGSGILALPKKTSPAGFVPSAVTIIVCWGFLLIEALLLAEINVALMKRKKERRVGFISIRSMAEQTLGEWGGTVATASYIFLAYASMVAYTAKSGEILCQMINVPVSISGIVITTLTTALVSLGGTQVTDRLNQWLTAAMIGLLLTTEAITAASGDWSALTSTAAWDRVPVTIPVIIFSLVYHDIAPVICSYLGGDLARIRLSVVAGSIVPLLALLGWNAVALSMSSSSANNAGLDPVDMLGAGSSEVSFMVGAFSLAAVGTSLIGTVLGFTQFFTEQLTDFRSSPLSNQTTPQEDDKGEIIRVQRDNMASGHLRKWWESNKLKFAVAGIVTLPPLVISNTVPDAFSAATDIAGGYCMSILYGVLPPAMAWVMHAKSQQGEPNVVLSGAKPGLIVCMGLVACGVVVEQMVQDLHLLQYLF